MSKERRATKFFCHDCDLGFEIFDPSIIGRNERKYCPKCGDHFNVKVLNAAKSPGKSWNEYELEKLNDYMEGKIKLYTLIKLTGRGRESISRKKHRINADKGIVTKKGWTDKEKALADKCINGEITLKELSEKTKRTIWAARRFVERRKTGK